MPNIYNGNIKTISKLSLDGDLINIIDEGCRSQIDNLDNKIKEIKEDLEILKAEIEEIMKLKK